MAKVIVKINGKTGATEVSAQGYQGETCKSKTKPFTDRLGVVTSDVPTPELYNEQTQNQTQDQLG